MPAPRLLYLPNENDLSDNQRQIGGRLAFAAMLEQGLIQELSIYSFLYEFRRGGGKAQAAREELLGVAEAFRPDIVFWQHPGEYPLDAEFLQAFRQRAGNPVIAYHEADPFDSFYKRIKLPQRSLYTACDVFLTVALGEQRRLFQQLHRHPRFFYSPPSRGSATLRRASG